MLNLTTCIIGTLLAVTYPALAEDAIVSPPPPTGRYLVGTTRLPIESSSALATHRQVQFWYPAKRSQASLAPYVPSDRILSSVRQEKLMEQPETTYDAWANFKTHAHVDAPALERRRRFPLIILMPGAGMPGFCYTSYAQELTSRGYVVATVDFSAGGFLVNTKGLMNEGPKGESEAIFGEQAADWARHALEIVANCKRGHSDNPLVDSIYAETDAERVAAIGHSQGGAAALEACRLDPKTIKACVNFDGVVLGYVAHHGISTTALYLRSHVDYSDADLVRLHRTREQWDARGKEIRASIHKLIDKPGGKVWVIQVDGTNHVSFSDCPFTMPAAISHYGGKIIKPERLLNLTADLIDQYLTSSFGGRGTFPPKLAPELSIQMSRN